ncbi:MAG: hypothetical protein U0V74_07945 [Chitinophagales bacterium]
MRNKIYILFVCKDNALWSQLAEAMVKLYRDDEINAFSAGIKPAPHIHEKAIDLSKRLGYTDMHLHTTRSVRDVPDFHYDFVITLGTPEYILDVAADKRLEWRLGNMEDADEVQLLRLRDKLLNRVLNLVISVAV